jgi:polyhydroxyalkanoate synthesis regulator phasin
VEYLEKQVDSIKIPDVTNIKTDVATVKADIESLERSVTKLEEGSKNPLAN